jgi:hypothetical protein
VDSIGGVDAECVDFTVSSGIGDQHGLAAHRAVFDIRLFGDR